MRTPWHVPDPVPFREWLRFLIEQGDGAPPFKSRNAHYSVAYWYQNEPQPPFPKLPSSLQPVFWAHEQQRAPATK